MKQLLQPQGEAVSSSSFEQPQQPFVQRLSTSSSTVKASERWTALSTPATEDPAASRDGTESTTVEHHGEFGTVCRWSIANFSKMKLKSLWSKYFEVGGYDCRLLVYPRGDSLSCPGYISVYLQITNPRGTSSSKWDCFASYRLSVVNSNAAKSVHRESWHRFSSKKKSHGWSDFTPFAPILDPNSGFLSNNDTVLVTCEILVLNESFNFTRDSNELQSCSTMSSVLSAPTGDVLSGKFTWKVHNFSMFKEMIRTQKITSPSFPAGECNLRISVYQSTVNGADHLSMCLESKDTDKVPIFDRSCWCMYRISILNQKPGLNHIHKDSYGRFAADSRSGDSTSLGWNDFMKMSDFTAAKSGFVVDDTAVFTTSFNVLKELGSFSKNGMLNGWRGGSATKKPDGHIGKFTWRIDNFTRLKDLLKKRKATGICIKSRRFQVGNKDCRLIIYPRGQSQPPCHLSLFLEVTDPDTSTDWSCFVSHRLSLVNQRMEDKSVSKESQNRYSKAAKDWGWREFVTLTSLFDQDSGFLVQDTVVFSAEVLILKETSKLQNFHGQGNEASNSGSLKDCVNLVSSFTWKIENFTSFKEIIETRKIFSKFFQAGGCELRIGVYESFDTICIYLESNQSVSTDLDNNFWVKYRMGVVNQKNLAKTMWIESSICTKNWNNSVLQFMKVSDMLEADAGYLARDTVVFVCEIFDCCPWFDFSDLEVFVSDDSEDALTTDSDEPVFDSEDSEDASENKNDIILDLLSKTGLQAKYGDDLSYSLFSLKEKLLMDAGEMASFLTGLRVYLDDPIKLKSLLLPSKLSGQSGGKVEDNDQTSPSLMNLLMGVKVLQQAITDLLLDIMVECCQPPKENFRDDLSDASTEPSEAIRSLESSRENGQVVAPLSVDDRLDSGIDEDTRPAVQSSDKNFVIPDLNLCCSPICPPETSASVSLESDSLRSKTKWPHHSEELLELIVHSLRAVDGAVLQGCPESRRMPQSAHKIDIVLDRAPNRLKPDLVALVPKLVDCSEHPLAAYSLLDRLRRPDAEPALRIPVFDAVSQLECGTDVWGRILFESSDLLADSNDELLAPTINFILKAGLLCQQLPEAVRLIRKRLKDLGADVCPVVLDYLSRIVNSCEDVARSFLRGIDCENDSADKGLTMPCVPSQFCQNGHSCEISRALDEQTIHGTTHFTDIHLLIGMLSIPGLAVEASATFERAIARGLIEAASVAMVFERRIGRNFLHSDVVVEGETVEKFGSPADDFASLLGLAETLALSREPHVKSFLKLLYTILFKMSPDESYRMSVAKRLVDRSTSSMDSCRVDSDLEILAVLVCQEQEIVRPVLTMMRNVAELANVDRGTLWHELCAFKDEAVRICKEKEAEISNLVKDKARLSQRLTESEATNERLKSRMKAETDKFSQERKELSERMGEFETQLDWLRSERDDEVGKLTAEKKNLQDRLRDAELQLSQLKSQKRDELKRVMKEKNVLAERLKSSEAARRRCDDELKRTATEKSNREEFRRSLEEKVRRLTETVGQTQGQKREKEEQVARCEAYIDGMEAKLQACQEYIGSLEVSLREEMLRQAPLYGVGLEALSMQELETLSGIHEEGLRQIHSLQQRKGKGGPLLSHSERSYNASSSMPNGAEINRNGYRNGSIGSWFNQT